MSLVLQKPLCPRCGLACSRYSKTQKLGWCSVCKVGKLDDLKPFKFFWNPSPEPSVDELGLEVIRCEARLKFFETIQNPDIYNKMVDNSLGLIQREKKYLEHLEYQRANADVLEMQAREELKNAQEQRRLLINEKASQTRGPSVYVDKRQSLETKLINKLGAEVYNNLRIALGSAEKVQEALVGSK